MRILGISRAPAGAKNFLAPRQNVADPIVLLESCERSIVGVLQFQYAIADLPKHDAEKCERPQILYKQEHLTPLPGFVHVFNHP